MRVVVADDHRIVREGLAFLLSGEADVELVGEAGDVPELLDLLGRVETDIVLLDVRMPGASGLDALADLATEFPTVKVIMLTMHDEPSYVRRAVEGGAAGYLLKSAGREEVLRALRAVAEGKAYIQGEVTAPLVDELGAPTDVLRLSPREIEVLQLVARGLENKQIARELDISEATVKTYLKSTFERLGARSRAEAVAVGLRSGLIE
jgi:DNA-binding NarL/FixJ family response regulator